MPSVLTFNLAIFLGAALLFVVQPMMAQMLLPMFGGSAAVWTVCVVTYQALLLAGYAYAHAAARWVPARWHVVLHAALLIVAGMLLPIHVRGGAAPSAISAAPVSSLLAVLVPSIGVPFFVLAATGPLLQVWFARSGHAAARDPYFLYSASNLGSLVGLLSFPFVIEPLFATPMRTRLWTLAYVVFAVLVLACGALAHQRRSATSGAGGNPRGASADLNPGIRLAPWRLLLLAFAPASLSLGVTTFILTDLVAVPLLWVLPLALYLLSFVVSFARRPLISHRFVLHVAPAVLLVVVALYLFGFGSPWWAIIPLHLLMLFTAGLLCHGELAASRPPAASLTTFYLWIAAGGVLGGLFNAAAPVLFSSVLEYPISMALIAFLVPLTDHRRAPRDQWLDVVRAAGVGGLTALLIVTVSRWLPAGPLSAELMFGPPALVCYAFRRRPFSFGGAVAMLMLASAAVFPAGGGVRLAERRGFFGVLEVRNRNGYHTLYHGNTVHGIQSPVPDRRLEPLAYYHRASPIGELFQAYASDLARQSIAIVGLGAGSLAGYAEPGQQWTFYEIDPIVTRIARDPALFTFLSGAKAPVDIVLGDARLSMNDAPPAHYHLIVLDAFSSDAVPAHLLTGEAIRLYLSKLDEGGLLAFNVSNRYLSLKRLMAANARALGLVALTRDGQVTAVDLRQGKLPSDWVILARRSVDVEKLTRNTRWTTMQADGTRSWTDDHTDLFSVVAFR